MKPTLITAFALSAISASAQIPAPRVVVEETVQIETPAPPVRETVVEEVVQVEPQPPVVRETVVEEVVREETPVIRGIDPELARRQLSMVPRALPVAPAPGTVVETTETTTTVDVPGQPRVYNTERNVVIVEGRELPYVTIPVLFVKETAELLDSESRVALEDTAGFIREIVAREPGAKFEIEGHTSTDGETDFNMNLSKQRALRVHEELTRNYSVPASALTASGFGESFPAYPNGTEAQMTQDRRVLVVRVK